MFANTDEPAKKRRRVADDAADAASTDGFFIDDKSRQQLQLLFDILDTDQDGTLEPKDWPSSAEGAAHWDKMRVHFDGCGDSKITPEKFVNAMKRSVMQQPKCLPDSTGGFPVGSHGELCHKLTKSVNDALQNLCKALYDSASKGVTMSAPTLKVVSDSDAMATDDAPQGAMASNAEAQSMIQNASVMRQIRDMYRQHRPDAQLEDATFESALTVISCKTQVVAGLHFVKAQVRQYFVKVQLRHELFSNRYVLLRIYKHSSNPPVLSGMKVDAVNVDSNEEF